ncbi:MAG: hypothetical protein QXI58_03565 [Candidatus Micrarchaeia archaeon]
MFGIEEFGKFPFGEASFYHKLWKCWPVYFREEPLKKFMEVCEEVFDIIRKYVKLMPNLYDSYRVRSDLLWYLAGNFGIGFSVFWQQRFLRRFIEYIGYWVQQKGRKNSIETLLRIVELGGQTRVFAVKELYSVSKLPGDEENNPQIFLSHIGDQKVIGLNAFLTGSWYYLIGEIGWYSKEELSGIPNIDQREIYGLSLLRIDVEQIQVDKGFINFAIDIFRLAAPYFVDITEIKITQ